MWLEVWRSCLSLPGSPNTALPLQRSTGNSTSISARTLKRRRSTRPLINKKPSTEPPVEDSTRKSKGADMQDFENNTDKQVRCQILFVRFAWEIEGTQAFVPGYDADHL